MKEPLQKLVRTLEDDLRERIDAVPELAAYVEREHGEARSSGRTGEALAAFRDQLVTQAAVSWVLAAVFVRFLEDNALLDDEQAGKERWIAGGTLELVDLARDQERAYFSDQPSHGEREYLLHVFEQIGGLPGMGRLFDPAHTPLWRLGPSADGARALIDVFRQRDPESGAVRLTFARDGLETRFLGDLYQDLSESARKRYALLQTPDFVEAFLLDRSLTPAVDTWGYDMVRLIDPACGSGHFLLGAFQRLLELHRHAAPAENPRVLVQRALDQVTGVDLNPFAAAIARFRLLVAALNACGITKLAAAADFRLHVAAGDSLLHGQRSAVPGQAAELFAKTELATPEAEHFFASEDGELLRSIFGQHYHVVVANPPYITVKDSGLRDLYRRRFPNSCHGQYSLVCPFLERLFDLAVDGGRVAAIVGNAFMKRQFGKKLVQTVLPHWDLSHVIDTSGAYLPGHGTPTVILLGRARGPVTESVRAVMGIRGEPSTPEVASEGKVWRAIVQQVDQPGSESEWVSVENVQRDQLAKHPWSLQGGGASDLLERIVAAAKTILDSAIVEIGYGAVTREDAAYWVGEAASRYGLSRDVVRPLVAGDNVRDWLLKKCTEAVWPYAADTLAATRNRRVEQFLWPLRHRLELRVAYGQTQLDRGLRWFEYSMFFKNRYRSPLSVAFAFVATHNHFVLDRGSKVFNRTAPVIKLPEGASVDDHLGLVGLLNSSTACFWMKQMFFCRGSTVDKRGARQTTVPFEDFWEHDGTKLKQFPLPASRPVDLANTLDDLGQSLLAIRPTQLCARETPSREALDAAKEEHEAIRRQMIALQEELDWRCYTLYGLFKDDLTTGGEDPPAIDLGERVFEIVLARRMAAGKTTTTWFERHGSSPITEIPSHWPEAYRRLVERRLKAIADHKAIGMIERPEFKRRWSREPWEKLEQEALRGWLLDRLEGESLWRELRLTSAAHLADRLRRDDDFRQVAALYRGRDDFELTRLITELVQAEGVPYLARQRYEPSGLRKRAVWEAVWDLQRQEDALDARTELAEDDPDHLSAKEAAQRKAALDIPVPPKYARADFLKASVWSLRGKLDVPKERFVLYPEAERAADPSPVLGWAGWDFLQRAQALAAWYVDARDQEAWPPERLLPLLDGLDELLPWLLQWHNETDPAVGMGLGTYFQGFVDEERRRLAEREEIS